MNKGLGLLILGGLAVLGGAIFAALLLKNKILRDSEDDFDDFDDFDSDFEYDDEDDLFDDYFTESVDADKSDKVEVTS